MCLHAKKKGGAELRRAKRHYFAEQTLFSAPRSRRRMLLRARLAKLN
jgi:hypothetical protein